MDGPNVTTPILWYIRLYKALRSLSITKVEMKEDTYFKISKREGWMFARRVGDLAVTITLDPLYSRAKINGYMDGELFNLTIDKYTSFEYYEYNGKIVHEEDIHNFMSNLIPKLV
jgi:hypothetical protein